MPIKYTDEMVAEALAMRARGVKQSVIHHIYGSGIEMAIRRVRARDEGAATYNSRLERAAYLLQKVLDSGALACEQHESLEADIAAFIKPPGDTNG
jgi:hypothetical protein